MWDAVLHGANSFFVFSGQMQHKNMFQYSFLGNMSFSVSKLVSKEFKKYEKKSWANFNVKQKPGFLFLSFRRVLNVICSFLGNSPASEF